MSEKIISKPIKVKPTYPVYSGGKVEGWVLPVVFEEFLLKPIFGAGTHVPPMPKNQKIIGTNGVYYRAGEGTTIAYFFPSKTKWYKRSNPQQAFRDMIDFRMEMMNQLKQNEDVK